jgi:hypothetical protein
VKSINYVIGESAKVVVVLAWFSGLINILMA